MPEVCSDCGAVLTEGNAFCTKCGARRSGASDSPAGQRFCTKCGTRLAAELKFCTKCGAPTGATAESGTPGSPQAGVPPGAPPPATPMGRDAVAQPAAAASIGAVPAAAPAATSGAATVRSSRGPKIAIVVVGLLLLLIVGMFASVTYVVHRVRQKAAQLEEQVEIERGLSGVASNTHSARNGTDQAAARDFAKSLADLAAAAQNNPAAAEQLKKKLADLTAAARDPKTQAALQDLNNKLAAMSPSTETGQNPGTPVSPEDIKKDMAELAAAANALGQGQAGGVGSRGSLGTAAGSSGPAGPASSASANSGNGSASALALASAAVDAALVPPPLPTPDPVVPVAGTGNPAHDWPLEYERTVGGPEADLLVRTGDINNLGFGWPQGFDPFSGQSTPGHPWPSIDRIPPHAPPGTDRIMLGTSVMPVRLSIQHVAGQPDRIVVDPIVKQRLGGDGYSGSLGACFDLLSYAYDLRRSAADCTRQRELTMPTPIVLDLGELPNKINSVVVQIFVDDFQPLPIRSHFQVSLNGTRIPSFEYAINSLDQSGPIGKLLTLKLLPEYWPLLKSGTAKLLIDDPTTHAPDGYAIDFVRILVNPHRFKYQVSLSATVTDADKHTPIGAAAVNAALESATTDREGKCQLKDIPAGLVIATASAPGYDETSVTVDLPAGQMGRADIQLHRHQETTAALEQSIAQTGSATIYGIHFDTGSSKLRADSMPALEAVLGLIKGRSESNWIIAGHTDNEGSDSLNIPLSKARAASVVSWLTTHGVTSNRLEPRGFGSTQPVADNATADGRALNRRVEVSLMK